MKCRILKEKAKTLSRCFEPLDTGEQREGWGMFRLFKENRINRASCCQTTKGLFLLLCFSTQQRYNMKDCVNDQA